MKNVFKHSKKGILIVTMLFSLLSFANDAALFNIKNEAKKTAITLYNVKQGNLLSVKDINGIILFKELIQETGTYTKEFDLTALPNGSYIFELEKGFEINSIPFTVKSNIVLFEKEKEKTIFKPCVRIEDNLVIITKLALNKEPLKIKIYQNGNSGDKLVYSEKIEDAKIIERVYKLKDLEKESYKIVLLFEDRKLTEVIN